MERQELDTFLRNYTEKERFLEQGKRIDQDQVHMKYEESFGENGISSKTYLFEDDFFLLSYENIGVIKQDRYTVVNLHKHNYIELIYVWSGTCTQLINGKRVVCQQGDICILDTKTIHSVDEAGENDIIINILMRKEFFAAAFFNRMTKQGILAEFLINAVTEVQDLKQFLLFNTQLSPKIHSLMENILCEYYNDDMGKREVMESYMIIIFAELLRIYRGNNSQHLKHNIVNLKLFDILEYIEKNYDNCTLHSVSENFGLNEKYLTMLLKKKTGRSFVEHVQEQRIKKAKLLLLNTDLPITEIIALCGYNNTNFFYKKFQNSENCTPAEYRHQLRKISEI